MARASIVGSASALTVLAGIVVAAATTGSALAADINAPVYKAPPAAVVSAPSWNGFYIGAGLGFRSTDTRVDVTSMSSVSSGIFSDILSGDGCTSGLPCALGEPFNGIGFRFAPYFGYNWQIGPRWVVGLEADVGLANQTTTLQGYLYPAPSIINTAAADSFAAKTTWDASARARAGYLVDPAVLLYVTGGPAWLHIESISNCVASCPPGFGPSVITDSTTRLGFTVGAGLEAMLWSNWILRGEYRYSDYGTISNFDVRACPSGCGAPFTESVNYDVKVRTHTATFGLAYKFDDASAAFASATPLAQQAYAAAPAAFSWTGYYLGAGVGVRATKTTATLDSVTRIIPGIGPIDDIASNCTNPKQSGCYFDDPFNGNAFRLNPYTGYNWQFAPQWVAGIEADFGWADQKTTLAGQNAPGTSMAIFSNTANDSFSVRTTWDASLRGRLGYLINPSLLVYAAAGPEWMHIEQTSTCETSIYVLSRGVIFGNCTPGLSAPAVITDSTTKLGFTIGGGFEARLWSNWFARAEYRYADFGTVHFSDVRNCAGTVTVQISSNNSTSSSCLETNIVTDGLRVRTQTATFGLAYKFN